MLIKSRTLSDRMEETYGVSSEKFLPVLKLILDKIRKPSAPNHFELWKPHLKEWNLNLSEKQFFDFWFSGESLAPELLDYIAFLKKMKIKVYILSNNFRERTAYYKKKFPEIFLTVKAYFSWETSFLKPGANAFLNVLKLNNLKPNECIYFDNSDNNIEVANRIGIHSYKYLNLTETKIKVSSLLNKKKATA